MSEARIRKEIFCGSGRMLRAVALVMLRFLFLRFQDLWSLDRFLLGSLIDTTNNRRFAQWLIARARAILAIFAGSAGVLRKRLPSIHVHSHDIFLARVAVGHHVVSVDQRDASGIDLIQTVR